MKNFFQVAIHFHPSYPQPKMITTSFCALVGFLLAKLNHYFDVSIDTNIFFGCSVVRDLFIINFYFLLNLFFLSVRVKLLLHV